MSLYLDEAAEMRAPHRGSIKTDQATSTSVEYIDLSAWKGQIVAIVVETVGHYYSFVESATPGTAPDATATTGAGAMQYLPPDMILERRVPEQGDHFLAYRTVSGTGKLRVSRDS